MLIASSLGFIKLLGLAFLLTSEEYGNFISVFGLASLVGSLISFGLIETTTKKFPIMIVEHKFNAILTVSKGIISKLFIRSLVFFFLLIITNFTIKSFFSAFQLALIFFIAYITSISSLLASIFRSLGNNKLTNTFAVLRGAASLFIVFLFSDLYGWKGGLVGEIASGALVITVGWMLIVKNFQSRNDNQTPIGENLKLNSKQGVKLYLGNMLVGSTTMIDKFWINHTYGPSITGTYGVVMLIPQILQLFVGALSQFIGPRVIKSYYLKDNQFFGVNSVVKWFGLVFTVTVLIVTTAIFLSKTEFLSEFFEKYNITSSMVLAAGLLASSQIYLILEFYLIAKSKEKYVLNAGIISTGMFYISFFIALTLKLKLVSLILIISLIRWLQTIILLKNIFKKDE